MDYMTKPASRKDLRRMSGYLRELFDVPAEGAFPVLECLDKLPDVFTDCNYLVVEDSKLPKNTMAQCKQNDSGGWTIEIKESVYIGAYEKGIGAFLGFICHEICHVFLFEIGYTPIAARSFDTGDSPVYRSVEWQAKALCGEVMIPFEESRRMSQKRLVEKYHVSKGFADVRRKLR